MKSAQHEFQPNATSVIYCRVSSKSQTKRGDGLGSQQQRCMEYARYKGLNVAETFEDDMTGSLATRPGMKAMLAYLRKHRKNGPIVVIIDDISRLARGIDAHLKLRTAIGDAGGILKSPTIEFGVSQHQRQKNGEQTVNRMRARVMNGFWCFACPVGYEYKRVPGQGNILVPDERLASIVTEALEGFAVGRFASQVEVRRFLESQPEYPKDKRSGEVHAQRVAELLTRPVYAGYVEAPNWNVPRRKGHHAPLISVETFERIQQRMSEGAKAPARKDLNVDFVLRGAISCADCGKPLTACWSRSKTGKLHPYYLCHGRGCLSERKSLPRDRVEAEFETLLRSLQPAKALFELVHAMFKNAWDQRRQQAQGALSILQKEIRELDAQTDKLLERIVETDGVAIVSAYEKKIGQLSARKLVLTEKLDQIGRPQYPFEDLFELAMRFVSSPWNIWNSGQFNLRRMVLRLAFAERISYSRENGFSNPKFALPFNILREIDMEKSVVARPKGFEPLTLRFVV